MYALFFYLCMLFFSSMGENNDCFVAKILMIILKKLVCVAYICIYFNRKLICILLLGESLRKY